MFDITAAASAATAPGPSLAESPGLKPKGGAFLCPGMGSQLCVRAGELGCTLALWQDEHCRGFIIMVGPGLAVLGLGKGGGQWWFPGSPCPAPPVCLPAPRLRIPWGLQSECILLTI